MKKFIRFVIVAFALLCFSQIQAQNVKPVNWRVSVKMTSEKEGILTMRATLEPGWHLYGTTLPEGGPKATQFDFAESKGIKFTGQLTPSIKPVEVEDQMFGMKLNWWDKTVTFTRTFTVTNPAEAVVKGNIYYMACNNQTCMPPQTESFSKTAKYYKR